MAITQNEILQQLTQLHNQREKSKEQYHQICGAISILENLIAINQKADENQEKAVETPDGACPGTVDECDVCDTTEEVTDGQANDQSTECTTE